MRGGTSQRKVDWELKFEVPDWQEAGRSGDWLEGEQRNRKIGFCVLGGWVAGSPATWLERNVSVEEQEEMRKRKPEEVEEGMERES